MSNRPITNEEIALIEAALNMGFVTHIRGVSTDESIMSFNGHLSQVKFERQLSMVHERALIEDLKKIPGVIAAYKSVATCDEVINVVYEGNDYSRSDLDMIEDKFNVTVTDSNYLDLLPDDVVLFGELDDTCFSPHHMGD